MEHFRFLHRAHLMVVNVGNASGWHIGAPSVPRFSRLPTLQAREVLEADHCWYRQVLAWRVKRFCHSHIGDGYLEHHGEKLLWSRIRGLFWQFLQVDAVNVP